jgi:hypothetical protein
MMGYLLPRIWVTLVFQFTLISCCIISGNITTVNLDTVGALW